jgi:uncharacterized protein
VADALAELTACAGFQWDDGNSHKNWERHRVSRAECEEIFFNDPVVAAPDVIHSENEPRYYVLGQTARGRRLFVACTIRARLIRIISVRSMSRRERRTCDQATSETEN